MTNKKMDIQPAASVEPVAYLIDWPDEPELGHYIAEAPTDAGRCRALVLRDAAPLATQPQPVSGADELPLPVFSKGPWLFRETGQEFSGADLDKAAFAVYGPAQTNVNSKRAEFPDGFVRVEAFNRLQALCDSQAEQLLAIDDAQTQPSGNAGELPDTVRVPLDMLYADAGYLVGRALDRSLGGDEVGAVIRSRLDEVRAALAAAPQPSSNPEQLPEALIPAEPDLGYLRSMAAGDNLPATLRGNILAAVRAIDAAPRPDSKTSGQAQQDAEDAARWRYMRRKLCLTGNGNGTCAMYAINLPAAIPGWPEPEPGAMAEFCDAAIDAARQCKEQP